MYAVSHDHPHFPVWPHSHVLFYNKAEKTETRFLLCFFGYVCGINIKACFYTRPKPCPTWTCFALSCHIAPHKIAYITDHIRLFASPTPVPLFSPFVSFFGSLAFCFLACVIVVVRQERKGKRLTFANHFQ